MKKERWNERCGTLKLLFSAFEQKPSDWELGILRYASKISWQRILLLLRRLTLLLGTLGGPT